MRGCRTCEGPTRLADSSQLRIACTCRSFWIFIFFLKTIVTRARRRSYRRRRARPRPRVSRRNIQTYVRTGDFRRGPLTVTVYIMLIAGELVNSITRQRAHDDSVAPCTRTHVSAAAYVRFIDAVCILNGRPSAVVKSGAATAHPDWGGGVILGRFFFSQTDIRRRRTLRDYTATDTHRCLRVSSSGPRFSAVFHSSTVV